MRDSRRFDVLVVGGGPAGAAAAILLAAAGRRILLVERTEFRGQRIGETLPPAVKPVLDRLGMGPFLTAGSVRHWPGTACCWGAAEPFMNDFLFDPDGEGLHLDRSAFDRALAMRAASVGAEVLLNGCMVECRRSKGLWHTDVICQGERRSYLASLIVDAAGRRKWRGRPGSRRLFDRQIACVARFEVLNQSGIDRRTWIETVPAGWWYSCALPGNQMVAAYFTDADLLRAPSVGRVWHDQLQQAPWTRDRLSHCRRLVFPTVTAASSSLNSVIAGDGYVAVGDAASTIDPLSSHGILYAMSSGIDAANALLGRDPAERLRHYAQETASRLQSDLHTRQHFCQLEPRWPESPFWQRRVKTPLII